MQKFVQHHRDLTKTALELKKICPQCQADECRMKCDHCKAVSYCKKECQVADWPKHKPICQEFQRFVSQAKYMKENALRSFFKEINEALAIVLNAAGFPTEISYVAESYEGSTSTSPLPVAVYDGRLYDATIFLGPGINPKFPSRKVQLIPTISQIPKRSDMYEYLQEGISRCILPPWTKNPSIAEYEIEQIRLYGCRYLIGIHYLGCPDRPALIRMYGVKTIKATTKETVDVFRARMNGIYKRNLLTPGNAVVEIGVQDGFYFETLNLKNKTRRLKQEWLDQVYGQDDYY